MNDFFIEYIDRCRRRVLYNVSIKVLTWWLTIALSGIVFSFLIKMTALIPTCLVAGVIVFYYHYKKVPGNKDIVGIIDKSLSLKEGLITAYQFREERKITDSFVSPLINHITVRLNVSRPALLFPLSFPKVLLVWPLLIIFLIFSRGLKNIASGGISNNSGSFFSSVKEDVNNPVTHEEIKRMDSADSSLPTGSLKPVESAGSKDLTQKGDQSSGKEISNETAMSRTLTKGHENQRDKNVPPILNLPQDQRGSHSLSIDRRGSQNLSMDRRGFPTPPERFPGEDKHANSSDSERVSSVSGIKGGKITSKGKSVILTGRGSEKNNLSTELPNGNGKWEAGQWKASYNDAMHVLIQQDIPDDYKEYVRRYFDAVQREEQVNGR